MLFGNKKRLAFEISPLQPNWERRYEPEQTAWSALAIWIHGVNLTEHIFDGSDDLRSAVNVPLAPLSDWLVRSWPAISLEERPIGFPTTHRLLHTLDDWGSRFPADGFTEDEWIDSRERWWTRHFLAAGADGSELPNIAFGREGDDLLVDWRRPKVPDTRLRFVNPQGTATLRWTESEGAAADLLAHVAEWLRRDGLTELYPWVGHDDPLRANTPDFLDALSFYTGRTIDEIQRLARTEDTAQIADLFGLDAPAIDPAASPSTQALRDLPPFLPEAAVSVLATIERETQRRTQGVEELRAVVSDALRDARTPESAGHEAAKAVRLYLALNGAPVGDTAQTLEQVGVKVGQEPIDLHGATMVAGYRKDGGAIALTLQSRRTTVRWGKRFEQARALGRLLTDPLRSKAVGAASSPFSTEMRRRRSGAFAAEFLLPESALIHLTGGIVDRGARPAVFELVMNRYGVGARTAAQQLWNVGLLSHRVVRDELIDTYGTADA